MDEREAIIRAMEAMGWDPDSEIPMASVENHKLMKELNEILEERTRLTEEKIQVDERVNKLYEHTKYVDKHIEHNKKLLQTYATDVQTERHLVKVAEREQSKIIQDCKNLDKDMKAQQEQIDRTEQDLCKMQKRVDKLIDQVNWAKNALAEWQQAMVDTNNGYQLIKKYFMDDEVKANQLENCRQRLVNEISRVRKELLTLHEEQKSNEQALECLAKLYRNAHAERRQMVETWKVAVHQMTQREKDIQKTEMRIFELKKKSKHLFDTKTRADNRLNEILQNNHEVELAIAELNHNTGDIKEQIQKIIDLAILKENEVETLQKELQNLISRVQQQRMENRHNAKELEKKTEELDKFEDVLENLERRLASVKDKTTSGQQRLKILEDMNDNEEKERNKIHKETSRINGLLYRTQEELEKLKSEDKTWEMDNDAIIATTNAVKKNIANLEKELRTQTQIYYDLGFKCLDAERTIIKLQDGSVDPEEEQKNLEYLAHLEDEYNQSMRRLILTEAQNQKLDDNMRNLTNAYNKDSKLLDTVLYNIKEAQAYCAGGVKRLKQQQEANQLLIVDLSILKMRTNEFEAEIARYDEGTYHLEKHQSNLQRVIQERLIEIKHQEKLLRLKQKHLNEEKNTLRADLGDRKKHIDAVRSRFELTTKLLGTNDDGSVITATQLRVEAAQEKQMLLDEGDELNRQVIQAEKDVKALENTVALFNNSNEAFRKKSEETVDEFENIELKELQCNNCKTLALLKEKHDEIFKIQVAIEQLLGEQDELEIKLEKLDAKRSESLEVVTKMRKERQDQLIKVQRAERELKNAIKAARQQGISEDYLAAFDRDLDVKEMEQRNATAITAMSEMATNDDMEQELTKLLNERGMKMPRLMKRTRSYTSWRSDTSMRSVSSSRDIHDSISLSSRSSASESSKSQAPASTTVSVVSIDFPGLK